MNIPNAKVYFDGSSYIAIAPKVGNKGKRPIHYEPLLKVTTPIEKPEEHKDKQTAETTDKDRPSSAQQTIRITPKELFESLYKANLNKNRKDRKQAIIDGMKEHFKTLQDCIDYVNKNIQRKDHNKLAKKLRICRKVNNCINDWNYFVTFTYDSEKHTEQSFRNKLSTCLSHLFTRKGWKYIGVWERSPEKQRLHLHGLLAIPDGTMPGEIIEVNDWDSKRHTRQNNAPEHIF